MCLLFLWYSFSKPGSTLPGSCRSRLFLTLCSSCLWMWFMLPPEFSWEVELQEAQELDFFTMVPSGLVTQPVELSPWSPHSPARPR